ncbi:excisionase family DNA binding protein [Roseateles depolymerans]|nr:excisionase family DNA binding protein [Roseateles depolymerans]
MHVRQRHDATAAWIAQTTPACPANSSEEITSEAASRLLHVSRTHLNALADAGVLGPVRRTEGGHRRLVKAEVMRHLKEAQDRQLKGVQDMMSASDELGLYEDEAKALRPKRFRRP